MPKQKISRRADGRIQKSKMIGGKRRYFYGETVKEVDAKIAAAIKEAESGVRPCDYTVAQWCEKWLEVYASKGYSVMATHKNVVAKLQDFLGNKQLNTVAHADIQIFANRCTGYAYKTVIKIKCDVNAIFRTAAQNGLIAKNPTEKIDWPYKYNGTHRALEEWERELITQNWHVHNIGIMAMIMLYAGLRRGEAIALRWSDVRDGYIHVERAAHFEGSKTVFAETTKTPAGVRVIPVLPPLARALESVERKGELICLSYHGLIYTNSSNRCNWITFCKKLQKLSPDHKIFIRQHDLRHTYATMLYDAGVDIKTAQYLLGHADISMTMKIYTHLSEKTKSSSIEKLIKFYSNK